MRPNHRADRSHDCDVILELIPDYAFGLTDATETSQVEAQLEHCPEAAAQLADFRRLQGELRAGVPQLELPPLLGERIMSAAFTSARTVKRRRQPFRLAWLAAAIAVIAFVVTNIYWLVRVDDLQRRQSDLASHMVGRPDNAFVLASVSDLRWVRLPPSQQNGTASAFLMWNGESEIGVLYVRGFPKLAVGRTYQLWLTRGEEHVSAGTLRVGDAGQGALLFHINEPIDKYTWARITTEPENGSPAPTGTPVVVGKLSA